MSVKRGRRYDFRWRRRHVGVLLVLCAAATGALGVRAAGRLRTIGPDLPVYPERIAAARERIDPNTASAASLRRLRGIGAVRALGIIEYRSTLPAPAFRRAEDLQRVRGIGPGTLKQMLPDLCFDEAAASLEQDGVE